MSVMWWTCVDHEHHVYAMVLGKDVARVQFDGRPDKCCLEVARTAARLAQLEMSMHRVKELSIGAIGFGIDRIGAADFLGSARDVSIIVQPGPRI